MASGHQALHLSDRVPWDDFGEYAERLVLALEGEVVSRADSPAERVWVVRIEGQTFWLSHDELGVSLDSQDPESSALIASLKDRLQRLQEG